MLKNVRIAKPGALPVLMCYSHVLSEDLTPQENTWKGKLGKSNFKSGKSLPLLIPSAVKIIDLPENFKVDILRLINATGPMRREMTEVAKEDVCKFGFGHFYFELMNCLRSLVWELYRMDCCRLANVILDHHLAPRISGKPSFQ